MVSLLSLLFFGFASATEVPGNPINLFGSMALDQTRAFVPSATVNRYETSYFYPSYQQFLTARDMFEKPLFVMIPSSEHESKLTLHYLHDGLKSVNVNPAFDKLFHYMRNSDLYGVVFFPQGIHNGPLFDMSIHDFVLPDQFKVSDMLSAVTKHDVPVLYMVPKAEARGFHFDSVKPVMGLGVHNNIVEPIYEGYKAALLTPTVVPAVPK